MTNGITRIKTANRDAWLALRSKYIGGSDAAAVIGLNPWVSPYSLWAEKTGKVPSFGGNLATEGGTYLEDFVAKKFEAETGKRVRRCNQSVLNSAYPWAIANIDREIVGEDAGLEIKTTDSINLKKFSSGEYPEQYYCQCIHYMAVTRKNRWYLAVLIGNRDFKWFTIERNEAEIAALMSTEREFWEYVDKGTPPPVDGSKATTETLKTLYADSDNDVTADLFCESQYLERYVELGNRIKELEKLQNEAANHVKEYMGSAAFGECDQYKVTWRSAVRHTFDSKRFVADNPDIDVSDYYRESITRAFRVTEQKGE